MNVSILFLLVAVSTLVEGHEEESTNVEARGKAKYALLMHLFYVVATKFVILKIIYGIMFYILLTKGWHFVLWFIQYLKQQNHVEYVDHDYHGHHDHHFESPYHGYGSAPYHGYGSGPYQAYSPYQEYDKQGYEAAPSNTQTQVYDSDGSYAVKQPVMAAEPGYDFKSRMVKANPRQ